MAIRMNDRFDHATRQKIKALIPLLLNSRGTREDEIARARFIAWRSCTVTLPILSDLLGLTEISINLRGFRIDQLKEIAAYCRENKENFRNAAKSKYAAYAYADAAYAATDAAAAYAYAYAYDDAAFYADDAAAYAAAYAHAAAAYAASYTYAASQKIKDSSIETLRLACSIKDAGGDS
jgi:hypothetical protein